MLARKKAKKSHYTDNTLLENKINLLENGIREQIEISKVNEKFGMKFWTESILSDNGEILINYDHELIQESISLQKKIAIETIIIGDTVMYGLVAIEKINEGETIIYASKLSESENDDMYKLELDIRTTTSARYYGNIARFMNHAPSQKSLDNLITFNTVDIEKNVAIANFNPNIININDQNTPILVANRDIDIGEKLYWDYGIEYFSELDICINLFDKSGTIINPENYRWKDQKLQIKFNNITKSACPLNEVLEKNQILVINFFKDGPHFQLAIHPDYIREKLNNNILSSNKYVTIEILEPFPDKIKVLSLDKELPQQVLGYFKENFLGANIEINFAVDLYKLTNDFKTDVNYPHNYDSFINFECDQQLAETIKAKCDEQKIKCSYHNTEIRLSFCDMFIKMPGESISDLINDHNKYKSPSPVSHNNFFKKSPVNNYNSENIHNKDYEFSSQETTNSFKPL